MATDIGGPGSGKITHCDRLARIDDRLFHLNMQTAFLEVASEIGKNSKYSMWFTGFGASLYSF